MESKCPHTVSVVMCTYNGEKYLAQQLDTILQQSFPASEIIIQDDGSKDKTCDIIKEYQNKYPFINLIHNSYNLGFNHNFLSVIQKAHGDYIAISDQDDLWETNKIEELVNTAENAGKAVCFSRSLAFSDETGIVDFFDRRTPNYTIERLIIANAAPGHTMLIKSDFIPKITISGFSMLEKWYYDEYIAVLASAYDELCFCDKYLVKYRRHSQQITNEQQTSLIKKGESSRIKKAFHLYFSNRSKMTDFYRKKNLFLMSVKSNNYHLRNARKMTWLLSRRDPISFLRLIIHAIRSRKFIYYTAEVKPWKLVLRALYFPFYCALYIE